jgi:WD40 repeat protein
MARIRRHSRPIAAALFGLVSFAFAPAVGEDQGQNAGTDLYDRPVLAIDPGMHTAKIFSQAVDAMGRFAVTGGADHTVRVWSVADGKLLRTIWIPVGPEDVGDVYAVAISPDGSTIAAGGWTERLRGAHPIDLFNRESGNLVRRIGVNLPNVTHSLTFSPDGRYLAATLGGKCGLRVFDRDNDWAEAFRDDPYGDASYGAAFAPDGRLATTSYDGLIRLYTSDPNMQVQTNGGLGVRLSREDGLIKIVAPIEGSPAARAGMLSGDVIAAIDEAPTQGLTLGEAVEKMRGAVNVPVKLKIVRGTEKEVKEFTIVRDLIHVQSVFRRVGEPVKAPSGPRPEGVAFSPDGKLLAVGYDDVVALDVLDERTLRWVGGRRPPEATAEPDGTSNVEWSRDGQMLFAAGSAFDAALEQFSLFAWDRSGLGDERRLTYCADDTATGLAALPDRRILVASTAPCLGLMDASGEPVWTVASPILDLRYQTDVMRASQDGQVVDFGFRDLDNVVLRFNVGSLALSVPPPNDGLTFEPNREGLTIDGWVNGIPTLNGRTLPLIKYDLARSLAVALDAKRFFLGSMDALTAFDDAGTQKWRWKSRNEVWAVNASKDGRVVVTASYDGAIRWHRADDGRELLALQVLPDRERDPAKWDWVLWTPEGFYEATPGAQDVLRWVVNHGPDKAATTLPVSAIAKLHRPDALRLVLDQLETERALGIAEVAAARLDVQTATGSAKPPGGVLHVLAIGVDTFGDKAGGLHLDYAAEDAHDVATALVESQKLGPGKASLYADVKLTYLPNNEASKTAIEDALDAMADSMAKSGADHDTAVILVSSHGEMIGGQFYLIPYGFVASGTRNAATDSAVPASVFAEKVSAIAAHEKVLVLLDACHSGAVGAGGWAADPNAKVLQDAMDFENVTVLTSSKRNELSEELPEWKHGALAQAFLDALAGSGDSKGIVTRSALTDAMENEVQSLTKDKQHLGMHVNFSGDLFVAGHY